MATTQQKPLLTGPDVQKAVDSGKYWKISVKDGKYVKTKVSLTGAKRMWAKDPQFIYYPASRVAGNAALLQQLFGANIDMKQVYSQASVAAPVAPNAAKGIMGQAGGALYAAYANEVAQLKAARPTTTKADQITDSALSWILAHVDDGEIGKVVGAQYQIVQKATPGTKKAKATRATKPKVTLMSRMLKLKVGKVMDASRAKPNGSGILSSDLPGEKSKKVGFAVSEAGGRMLVSNNENGLLIALRSLGLNATQINQYVAAWRQAHAQRTAPVLTATQIQVQPMVLQQQPTVTVPVGVPTATALPMVGSPVGSPVGIGVLPRIPT